RLGLAGSLYNLGNLLDGTNRPKEAETAFREALALAKQLWQAGFSTGPDLRYGLALSLLDLSKREHITNRPKEAEADLREALAILEPLVADFPKQADFCRTLAGTHHALGALLQHTKRLKEAEAAYRDAVTLLKQLALEFPQRADFRQQLHV